MILVDIIPQLAGVCISDDEYFPLKVAAGSHPISNTTDQEVLS